MGVKHTDTFDELVLRHRRLLFSVCHRYARRGMEADDLLQEVMLTLWHRREQLLSIGSAPQQAAWMWRVARSTCVDLLRRSAPSYPAPEDYDAPVEDHSQHEALMELITQLPEPDRTVVTLHLEGYDYREIGQRTGLGKSNVGVRLMRIKEKLRQQWNQ